MRYTLTTKIYGLLEMAPPDEPAGSPIGIPFVLRWDDGQGRGIVGFEVLAPLRDIDQMPGAEGGEEEGVVLDHVHDPGLTLTFSLLQIRPLADALAPAEDPCNILDQIEIVTEGAELLIDVEGLGEHIEPDSILSLVAEPLDQVGSNIFPFPVIPEKVGFVDQDDRA